MNISEFMASASRLRIKIDETDPGLVEAREITVQVVTTWSDAMEALQGWFETLQDELFLTSVLDNASSRIRNLGRETYGSGLGEEDLLTGCIELAQLGMTFMASVRRAGVERLALPESWLGETNTFVDAFAHASAKASQRRSIAISNTLAANARRALETATEAADQATGAANTARRAAGEAGEAELGQFYGAFGQSQIEASKLYRFLTIASAGLAAVVASIFFFIYENDQFEVQGVVYRAAVLVGIAGLSTYFGRLAGQHRRLGNWALTIEVQLKSFEAFLAPMTEPAARDALYADFCRRALGAPPEGNSSDAPVIDVKDLTALLAARGQ